MEAYRGRPERGIGPYAFGGVMSEDFETTISINEEEIELLGNLIVAHMTNQERVNPSKVGDPIRPESVFLDRLLRLRTGQIIAARAAGKLPPLPRFNG